MECNKCKQQISIGQKFCTYCGTKIEDLSINPTTDFDLNINELKSAIYSLSRVKEYARNNDDLALKVENQLISHIELLKTKLADSADEIFVPESFERVEYLKDIIKETAKREGLSLNQSTLNDFNEVKLEPPNKTKNQKKSSFIPSSTIAVLLASQYHLPLDNIIELP